MDAAMVWALYPSCEGGPKGGVVVRMGANRLGPRGAYTQLMKFQVVFSYDSDYEGYVAEVPALPGCLSQGKTLDEAKTNIRDAIQGYLLVLQEPEANGY